MDALRILAVEDNPADFRLLTEYLREDSSLHFEIVRAGTLKEALEILLAGEFAVVLLDLHLPDGCGLDVLDSVIAVNPTTPVIVLTGGDNPEIGLLALSKKAQDYLVKGRINGNSLIRCIRYAIERNKGEEAARQMNAELAKRAADIQSANEALQASRLAALNLMEDALEARSKAEQVSAELRESRGDLNRAQAVAHTGSWRLNVQRNELLWSDENWRIFGVPRGTPLTYETFLSTVHPDDRAYVHEKWSAGLRGEPYDIEHRIVVNGKIKWVRERAELELDEKGRLLGGFGTTQDITEKKQAEEALRRAKEEWERTFDSVPDLIAILDHQNRIVRVNRAMAGRFGMNAEACIGMPCYRVMHGTETCLSDCPYTLTMKDGRSHTVEVREEHLDADFLVTTTPFLDNQGRIIGTVHVARDITERKRAEESLREAAVQRQSAQYARTLIEVSIDPLVTISPDGKITDVNEAMIKGTGAPREELVGSDFSNYFTEPENAREGYRQVFAKGFVTDYPLTIRHRHGRLIDVLYNASVYKDIHGKVLGAFAAARDVTAQKQAEAERERYRRHLQELVKRLASTEERERRRISNQIHDTIIQTLSLSNIKLGAVRKELADSELPNRADDVNNVRSLIEEAIKESRSLMAELTPPLLYELGLAPALQDLTQRLEKRYRIPIRVHDDGLPKPIDKRIHGSLFDAARELIVNALKHAGQCAITISLSRENDRLRICVEDNGVGFKVPEDGRFAFHPNGGFGLFSIRERLDRIGGKLDIDSQPGKGTTATILVALNSRP